MSDDKNKVGKTGSRQVNVHKDYELHDWSKKFGVTKEQLKQAVQTVGDSAEAARKHLGK